MKFILTALLAYASLLLPMAGQSAMTGQQKAIAKHPELAIEKSPLNEKFLSLVEQARRRDSALFRDSNWPIILADRAVAALEIEKAERLEIEQMVAAAKNGAAQAQYEVAFWYNTRRNFGEGVKWMRKAAEQGLARAQRGLGRMYYNGQAVPKDLVESARWVRKAADQGEAEAQWILGCLYLGGFGVRKDPAEGVEWLRKAAEQGDADAQGILADQYEAGVGVAKSRVEAYRWYSLAAAKGSEAARRNLGSLESKMLPAEIAEAQRLAQAFKPHLGLQPPGKRPAVKIAEDAPVASGTGFFLTSDGYFVTNYHVVKNAAKVRLRTSAGEIAARIVKIDPANDLAVLKADGDFSALAILPSRAVRLGATVATVGFPNPELQGFTPKLAKGEIASLAGVKDDPHNFQISVPVQPGNSGGALVDENGNVVGVVVAKLSQKAALATSGVLAENVNYAVKSSYLLSLLESLPELSAKLKEPDVRERKFEVVIQDVQKATALVLVY